MVCIGHEQHQGTLPAHDDPPVSLPSCATQAAADERSAAVRKVQLATEQQAAALEAAQAQLRQRLEAALARIAELEAAVATAAAAAAAAEEAGAIDVQEQDQADGAEDSILARGGGSLKVTPLLAPSKRSTRARPAGVPLLLSAGKWAVAAGAVGVLGLAAAALGGGSSQSSGRRVGSGASKVAAAANAPAPATDAH